MDPRVKRWIFVAIGAVAALAVAFTAGRFSAPTKIEEKEKIVYKDKEVFVDKEKLVVDQKAISEAVRAAQSEWKKKLRTRTVTKTLYANGQIQERISWTETTVDESSNDTSTSFEATVVTSVVTQEKEKIVYKEVEKVIEKERKVESATPRYRLGLGAGLTWDHMPTGAQDLKYEGHAEIRLVGGLWVGVNAIPQLKFGGLTLSLQF